MDQPVPEDRCGVTLSSLFLLGVASLLPWNFFITANDYWMFKFRDTNATFSPDQPKTEQQLFFGSYLSITSNVVFIVFLGLNTLISKRVSSNTRIIHPLIATIALFVLTTSLVKVNSDQWQTTFLVITLVIVALINVLVGFLMGASMGVCGYLPSKYMACCSLGQAVGGLICCAAQIICLLFGLEPEDTALIYFTAATVMLCITLASYLLMRATDFFQHYAVMADGSLSISYKNTHVPYWTIFRRGWQFHVSCFLIYAVTIAVFPGLTIYVVSTHYSPGSLLSDKLFVPLACFTVFNAADCIGRYMFNWCPTSPLKTRALLISCMLRVIIVPLLLVCNVAPQNRTLTPIVFESDSVYIFLILLAGLSNGYLINAAFVYAPKTVETEWQEVSEGMASWFTGIGSAVGAVLSYGVVQLL